MHTVRRILAPWVYTSPPPLPPTQRPPPPVEHVPLPSPPPPVPDFFARIGVPDGFNNAVLTAQEFLRSNNRLFDPSSKPTGKLVTTPLKLHKILIGFRVVNGGNMAAKKMNLAEYRKSRLFNVPLLLWSKGYLYLLALKSNGNVVALVDGVRCPDDALTEETLSFDNGNDQKAQIQEMCRLGQAAAKNIDIFETPPEGVGFVMAMNSMIEIGTPIYAPPPPLPPAPLPQTETFKTPYVYPAGSPLSSPPDVQNSGATIQLSSGGLMKCVAISCTILLARMLPYLEPVPQ